MSGPDEIVERLLREGPGSHGIVLYRPGVGRAHVVNVFYDASLDGVVFFDGQKGRLESISPENVLVPADDETGCCGRRERIRAGRAASWIGRRASRGPALSSS
jgi:hypothetical protein